MKQQNLQVGAYTRLSRDDDSLGESGSIVMQKEIIRQYCERNGMGVKTYYQDDGFTGTNYNRPDFQRMIADIESGKINCVITKDLSRLGRDYIMTGYYTEIYFPEHSVRYIAIGDNYDTQDRNNSNNDFAPFKFIVNDLYAKDISKKIRASKNAKFLNGEQLVSHPPYGYKKDPNLKNHYVIDEETAPVVRKIFEMYANGVGRNTIVKYLRDNKILMPAAVLHERGIRYSKQMEIEENRYRWSSGGLSKLFKNPAYIGDTVHYQYQKVTNKSKVRKNKPENVLTIKGTHEPIIDMDT
ncbi:recombinase family protein [Acetobacterium carbinolicum]|uniref:recombinase family protein n=1 Tax=Acetobacterium carbinolicum TaxID=52690 RepID=UPI0039BEDFBB